MVDKKECTLKEVIIIPLRYPKIIQIKDIPYTINGKKVEIAVRDIIHGLEPQNQSALANPESLSLFKNLHIRFGVS